MNSIKSIAAAGCVMLSSHAYAVDWVYATTTKTGTVIHYDADTIRRAGNLVTVWEKWDHSRDKTVKERRRIYRYRYDCAERAGTLIDSTVYYTDGKIRSVNWEPYQQKVDPIIPGSLGEEMLETICAAAR